MVLEWCAKGVIMKVDLDRSADPYPEEQCRLWFRDMILGIEYCEYPNSLPSFLRLNLLTNQQCTHKELSTVTSNPTTYS